MNPYKSLERQIKRWPADSYDRQLGGSEQGGKTVPRGKRARGIELNWRVLGEFWHFSRFGMIKPDCKMSTWPSWTSTPKSTKTTVNNEAVYISLRLVHQRKFAVSTRSRIICVVIRLQKARLHSRGEEHRNQQVPSHQQIRKGQDLRRPRESRTEQGRRSGHWRQLPRGWTHIAWLQKRLFSVLIGWCFVSHRNTQTSTQTLGESS